MALISLVHVTAQSIFYCTCDGSDFSGACDSSEPLHAHFLAHMMVLDHHHMHILCAGIIHILFLGSKTHVSEYSTTLPELP